MRRIIVALDGMDPRNAQEMAERLAAADCDEYWGGKGNDLIDDIGARPTVRILKGSSNRHGAFVDPKLHDTTKTVVNRARKLAQAGADFITVHAALRLATLKEVVKVTTETNGNVKLLAVSVLTDETQEDIDREYGIGNMTIPRLVRIRAEKAVEAGCWGMVSAAGDLEVVRDLPIKKVTPNIRLENAPSDDQNRERQMTPEGAIAAGSDFLVVGRPITDAQKPIAALLAFAERIRRAA